MVFDALSRSATRIPVFEPTLVSLDQEGDRAGLVIEREIARDPKIRVATIVLVRARKGDLADDDAIKVSAASIGRVCDSETGFGSARRAMRRALGCHFIFSEKVRGQAWLSRVLRSRRSYPGFLNVACDANHQATL
jgi:hypothetical protein